MNTRTMNDINFWGTRVQNGNVLQEYSLMRPMSEIGRMNYENSKATINSIVKGLRAAIEHCKVPAIVAVASSKRAPHDLAIWPRPGALIRKTPVHWSSVKDVKANHTNSFSALC